MRAVYFVFFIGFCLFPALGAQAQDLSIDPALASLTDQELVDTRQSIMEQNNKILLGAEILSGTEAETAALTLLQNFTNFPALFREGSLAPGSRALPAIWQPGSQFADFTDEALLVARMMHRGAQTSDSNLYLSAVAAMKRTCDECHQVFRAE